MNKKIILPPPYDLLLLLLSLTITTAYAAQTTIEEPFTEPTHYSVCFATGLPKVYPAAIISKLHAAQTKNGRISRIIDLSNRPEWTMQHFDPTNWVIHFPQKQASVYSKEIADRLRLVKIHKKFFPNDTSQTVDLSPVPYLTKEKFNALAALIQNPTAIPVDDKEFLTLVATTYRLLEENDPLRTALLETLLTRTISTKNTQDGESPVNTERYKFFKLFSRHMRHVFIETLKAKVCKDNNQTKSYYNQVHDYGLYSHYKGDNKNTFPTTDSLTDFPLSLKDLIKANKLPLLKDVKDKQNNKHIKQGKFSIVEEHLTSLKGLPLLPDLYLLDGHSNFLRTLPARTFAPTPNLDTLILHSCHIEKIDPAALSGLMNLRILNLSHNRLTQLNPIIFKDLIKLQVLLLSYNDLKDLPQNAFSHTPSIRRLNLQNNQLAAIDPFVFAGFAHLELLNLKNNRFKEDFYIPEIPETCKIIFK